VAAATPQERKPLPVELCEELGKGRNDHRVQSPRHHEIRSRPPDSFGWKRQIFAECRHPAALTHLISIRLRSRQYSLPRLRSRTRRSSSLPIEMIFAREARPVTRLGIWKRRVN
jgi:hypothetical protein